MDKVKQSLRNLSLRKSIVFYIIIFMALAIFLSACVTRVCQSARTSIANAYPQSGKQFYLTTEDGERLGDGAFILDDIIIYTEADEQKIDGLNFIETVSSPILFALCMLAAVFLFYRKKLKTPLAVLDKASERIADNDLDFSIDYASKDEMGKLCASFEKMRFSLDENNRLMWRQMEQRKRLNAAFAHDLRTPLTVLKGYSEILQLENDRLVAKDTATTMSKHIDRLERYVDSMSSLQRIEDISPDCRTVDMQDFILSMQQTAELICEKARKTCIFHSSFDKATAELDAEMITTVLENLVSNAARYAHSKVKVDVEKANNVICITVLDDGSGFTAESIEKATEPYYTGDTDKANHFGLGPYICKQLCRQHGGSLQVQNADGGGKVIASFKNQSNRR